MKLSVSTYSLHRLVGSGEYTHRDLVKLVKEIGFDAIETTDIAPVDGLSVEETAKLFKEEADKYDLPISSYTVSADFITGSDGDYKKEIEKVKAKVDVAAILGVECMRHDVTRGFNSKAERSYRGFDNVLPLLADCCREVTEYAQSKGIKTMVENHGYFAQDADRVEKLVNTVAHDNFGLLVDMGNFLCADENPVVSVGKTAPYAFYVHAKDWHIKPANSIDPGMGYMMTRGGTYIRGAIIGHGDVPILQCLRALKRAEYDGYVSIEFEGMENPIDGVKIGYQNLRRMLEMI